MLQVLSDCTCRHLCNYIAAKSKRLHMELNKCNIHFTQKRHTTNAVLMYDGRRTCCYFWRAMKTYLSRGADGVNLLSKPKHANEMCEHNWVNGGQKWRVCTRDTHSTTFWKQKFRQSLNDDGLMMALVWWRSCHFKKSWLDIDAHDKSGLMEVIVLYSVSWLKIPKNVMQLCVKGILNITIFGNVKYSFQTKCMLSYTCYIF